MSTATVTHILPSPTGFAGRHRILWGRIYGWIPSGDLLGSVTQVRYLEELHMNRNT